LHLANSSQPIRVELEGNFLRDIAGCRVDLHNPCPEVDLHSVAAMDSLQTGHTGIITGSYRVARLPRRKTSGRRAQEGVAVLPDPPGLKNLTFFEWFNEQGQRILVQSWHLQLRVSAPRWSLTREEENRLLRANRARRRTFLLENRRRQRGPVYPSDPFVEENPGPPPEAAAGHDPFGVNFDTPSPKGKRPVRDSEPLPDPFQRSELLAAELRQFEQLLWFQDDVGSRPAVLQLLSTVGDLAAHLGHTLRQFVTSHRENWEFLLVDLEQSLPLFSAALSATEQLVREPGKTTDQQWLQGVQSALLTIEMRMRELLALIR